MEPTMASRTFHPFSKLPKELRDAIWALAIRSKRPSAHSFTVFDSSNDAEWSLLSQYSIRHPLVRRYSLAAPQSHTSDDHHQQFSWVRGNRSAYLIDSGLWTACMESRDAIERRFKVAEWDLKRQDMRLPNLRKNLPDAPATALFTSNGEWLYCLTHPKSDLFLLRPFNAETVDWDTLWTPVPIFNPAENFYVSHIAIDYDPGWLGDTGFLHFQDSWASLGTIGYAIRAATNQLEWAENLWFVDYRIRRSPGALTTTTSRYQFHGNDCKSTEVRDGDMNWELDHTRDIFKFLEELDEQVDEYFHDVEGSSPWDQPACHFNAPNVGVLAYEECEPEAHGAGEVPEHRPAITN